MINIGDTIELINVDNEKIIDVGINDKINLKVKENDFLFGIKGIVINKTKNYFTKEEFYIIEYEKNDIGEKTWLKNFDSKFTILAKEECIKKIYETR